MSGEFKDPDQFGFDFTGGRKTPGSNPKAPHYPENWGDIPDVHVHEANTYNPHLDMFASYPDGTLHYYDPVTHTWSLEHCSGYHKIITHDHVNESNPGEHVSFVAGHEVTSVGGHQTTWVGGHQRTNVAGGSYTHIAGDSATHHGGNHAENFAGHSRVQIGEGGHYELRLAGQTSAYVVGVTMGSDHISTITMTANNTYVQTKGNVVVSAGRTATVLAGGDMNIVCGGKLTMTAGDEIDIFAPKVSIGKETLVGAEYAGQPPKPPRIITEAGPAKFGYGKP